MNKSLKILSCILICMAMAVSCDKSDSDSGSGGDSSKLSIESTMLGMTGASVTVKIQNTESSIITRLNFGILYVCAKDLEGAPDSLFNVFKDNGETDGIEVKYGVNMEVGYKYILDITSIAPNEKVYCCGFFVRPDGSREISSCNNFTTLSNQPTLITNSAKDIRFYDAKVEGLVDILEVDKKSCKYGIMYSENEDVALSTSKKIEVAWNDVNNKISETTISGLKGGVKYYYRTYLCLNDSDYSYGEVKSFNTRSYDEMAVDLGLSVKWSAYNLGAQDSLETGNTYAWGHLKSFNTSVSNRTLPLKDYMYYSMSDAMYIDIGMDISGTEYDVAHKILGGKWRMPTKMEVEELLRECNYSTTPYSSTSSLIWVKFEGNGNKMFFSPESLQFWTATLDYYPPHMNIEGFESPWFLMLANFYIGLDFGARREKECFIRPVCDY